MSRVKSPPLLARSARLTAFSALLLRAAFPARLTVIPSPLLRRTILPSSPCPPICPMKSPLTSLPTSEEKRLTCPPLFTFSPKSESLTVNPLLKSSMKIQVQLLPSPPRAITTKSGARLVYTGLSGDDVLHISFPESIPAPKAGVDTVLTGAYLPARRMGDVPSFWVRA